MSFRKCDIYEGDILSPLVIRYQFIKLRAIEISYKPQATGLGLYVIHVQMSRFQLNRVAEVILYFFKYSLYRETQKLCELQVRELAYECALIKLNIGSRLANIMQDKVAK